MTSTAHYPSTLFVPVDGEGGHAFVRVGEDRGWSTLWVHAHGESGPADDTRRFSSAITAQDEAQAAMRAIGGKWKVVDEAPPAMSGPGSIVPARPRPRLVEGRKLVAHVNAGVAYCYSAYGEDVGCACLS